MSENTGQPEPPRRQTDNLASPGQRSVCSFPRVLYVHVAESVAIRDNDVLGFEITSVRSQVFIFVIEFKGKRLEGITDYLAQATYSVPAALSPIVAIGTKKKISQVYNPGLCFVLDSVAVG